jgi:hypothetical protein
MPQDDWLGEDIQFQMKSGKDPGCKWYVKISNFKQMTAIRYCSQKNVLLKKLTIEAQQDNKME